MTEKVCSFLDRDFACLDCPFDSDEGCTCPRFDDIQEAIKEAEEQHRKAEILLKKLKKGIDK